MYTISWRGLLTLWHTQHFYGGIFSGLDDSPASYTVAIDFIFTTRAECMKLYMLWICLTGQFYPQQKMNGLRILQQWYSMRMKELAKPLALPCRIIGFGSSKCCKMWASVTEIFNFRYVYWSSILHTHFPSICILVVSVFFGCSAFGVTHENIRVNCW